MKNVDMKNLRKREAKLNGIINSRIEMPPCKESKPTGNIFRNDDEKGICPICNHKLHNKPFMHEDGSSPFMKLYLGDPNKDGLYFMHLECYNTLYECLKTTISFHGKSYLVHKI